MVGPLRLQMSTSRLFSKSQSHENGEHLLVVLLQQVHGILRHTVLCAAQEERARVDAARDPPRDHAHVCVVRSQVCAWWSQHILRSLKHFRTYRHVFLLHGVSDGPQVPEVYLVEEIPHCLPDGAIRSDIQSPAASFVPAVVSVPARVRLLDRDARLLVPVPLQ